MRVEYSRDDVVDDMEVADLLDMACVEIAAKTGVPWKRVMALAYLVRCRARVFDVVLPRPSNGGL